MLDSSEILLANSMQINRIHQTKTRFQELPYQHPMLDA